MAANELFENLQDAVVKGEIVKATELAQAAVDQNLAPGDTIRVAAEAMKITGQLFESKEYFVADMIASAEAMKGALSVLTPLLNESGQEPLGKVILGSVEGDVHDIGKNLVGTVMTTNGFEVHDLGINVSADTFADKAEEIGADIVGTSAYTATAMEFQRDVLEELTKRGLRDKIVYLVGGAPTNAEWAAKIGADGWGEDAWHATKVATELLNQKRSKSAA
jgi:5-methyltetrahydrofolate--homocysteine methyltransferase